MKKDLSIWIATGFGVGYAPVAPGTFGTLLGFPIVFGLIGFDLVFQGLAIIILAAFGVFICGVAEKKIGKHDPGEIVYDEFSTLPITFFGIDHSGSTETLILIYVVGFALHRVFDISKPFPINYVQRWPKGWGIMADDCLAGMISCVLLHVFIQIFF